MDVEYSSKTSKPEIKKVDFNMDKEVEQKEFTYMLKSDNLELSKQPIGTGQFSNIRQAIYKEPGWKKGIPVVFKLMEMSEINAIDKDMLTKEFLHQSSLTHDNIVKAFGVISLLDNSREKCGFALEYMDGPMLSEVIAGYREAPYTIQQVVSWAYQAADALTYMHSLEKVKIIHRDIKPENMILNSDRSVLKISDFGLARELTSYAKSQVGSPIYMAPEIFVGELYNETCDIYSWALSFWECCHRKRPFSDCKTKMQLYFNKTNEDYRLAEITEDLLEGCENCSEITKEFDSIIQTGSAYNRKNRGTMAEFKERLSRFVEVN